MKISRKQLRRLINEHVYGSRQYNARRRPVNPIERIFNPEDREKAQTMFDAPDDNMGFDDMAFELGQSMNQIIPNEPGNAAIEPQTKAQFDAQMARYESEELRNSIMNNYDWQTESQLLNNHYDYQVYLDQVIGQRSYYGEWGAPAKSPHEDYAEILGCNVNDLRFLFNRADFDAVSSLLHKLEKVGSFFKRGIRLPKEKSEDIFGYATTVMTIFSPKIDKTEPTRYRYLTIDNGNIKLIVTCK